MQVIKSDGRFNYHRQGFKTIMEFRVGDRADRNLFYKLNKILQEFYGEPRFIDAGTGRWKMNDDYRTQTMSDNRRRRIYLRSEAEVTMLMLKVVE